MLMIQAQYILDLSIECPEAVEKMVEYLYTQTYFYDPSPPDQGIHLSVSLYAVAQKYTLPGCAELSRRNYAGQLKDVDSLPDFFTSIEDIYKSTPVEDRGMRDLVVNAVAEEMYEMMRIEVIRVKCLELMEKCPAFWRDLLLILAEAYHDRGEPVVCGECGPRDEEPYDIEVECRGCGKWGMVELR